MAFNGFPKEGLAFFRELARNNTTDWFKANKPRYQELIVEPSREFVVALGERLRELAPDLIAEPKVNKSLFRLNRDTRFSKDKTPYKGHAGIWLWEGPGKRMECSGFYFHLAPEEMIIGTGIYMFPKELMAAYRDSVANPKHGEDLARVIDQVQKAGPYNLGGEMYKRVPRGFPADHPRAELLKRKGLFTGLDKAPGPELHTPELIEFCYREYRKMAPLHHWLKEMTLRAIG
jgi:uncharacterized protein (TIGR02453 family)